MFIIIRIFFVFTLIACFATPAQAVEVSVCDIELSLGDSWRASDAEQKKASGLDAVWINPATRQAQAGISANSLTKTIKEEATEMADSAKKQPEFIRLLKDRTLPTKDPKISARAVSLQILAGNPGLGIQSPMVFHSIYVTCPDGSAASFKLNCGQIHFEALRKDFEAGVLAAIAAAGVPKGKAEFKVPMEAPKGYTWATFPEIKAGFLKPDGWHVKAKKMKGTQGVFITKENIDEKGAFMTGLTVNIITDIPAKKKMTPLEFAVGMRKAAKTTGPLLKEWERDMGPFKAVGFRRSQKDPAGAFITHNLYIANNKTGTMYMVIFEAPSDEWNVAWQIAEPMMKFLYIDDTI